MNTIIGRWADDTGGDNDNWVGTDPLFIVGNGLDINNKSNAIIEFKNGDVTVQNNITANQFIGDGSLLTGIVGTAGATGNTGPAGDDGATGPTHI